EGGPVRHHPVVEPLSSEIRGSSLSRVHFDRLIDARETDLADEPPATVTALEDYAEASSSRLVYLALEILGARDPATTAAGRHVGIAYALAGLLRRGQVPVPLDPAELAAAASRHLEAASVRRRMIPPSARPALLPAIVAKRWLKRLKQAQYDPLDPAVASPDPLQSWR